MKSVILAAAIFILITILVIGIYAYNDILTGQMLNSLEKNEKFIAKNDWESAKNEMKSLSDKWSKNKDILAVFVTHSVIDELDSSIFRTSQAVKNRKNEEFHKETGITKLKIKALKNLQTVSVSNLF